MTSWLEFGRHSFLCVDLCDRDYQRTILAFSRDNNLLLFAAFERGFKAVEAQAGFWPFASVAAET
jgi:hypothetical protein